MDHKIKIDKQKKERDPDYINYIRNFSEAYSLFHENDIFDASNGCEILRKRIILAYDYPNKKEKLASLPDLIVPKNNPSLYFDILPELLNRGHTINEVSSRGSLLHLIRKVKTKTIDDTQKIQDLKLQIKKLGGLDFITYSNP